jgi:hypothetical protein
VAGQIESAQGVLAGDFLDIVELDDQRVASCSPTWRATDPPPPSSGCG